MYSKVIVPLDGSDLSERSLPYARLIASVLSVPIELVEAFDILPPAVHNQRATMATRRMLEIARAQMDDYLAQVRAELVGAGFSATAITLPGAPAEAIADWVDDDPEALLVMATHGRGGIARWALGSVADKVLHVIPNPMLLIRDVAAKTAEEAEPKAVLVPLDGSTLSELSLEHAAIVATALGSNIVLLRVNPDVELYRQYMGSSRARGGKPGLRTNAGRRIGGGGRRRRPDDNGSSCAATDERIRVCQRRNRPSRGIPQRRRRHRERRRFGAGDGGDDHPRAQRHQPMDVRQRNRPRSAPLQRSGAGGSTIGYARSHGAAGQHRRPTELRRPHGAAGMKYLAVGIVGGIAIGVLVAFLGLYGVAMLGGLVPGC